VTDTELSGRLAAFPRRLREATAGLDASTARRRPSSDGWSAVEIVCHLRDYAELLLSLLKRAPQEERPRIFSYSNDEMAAAREYGSQDLQQVIAAAEGIRARTTDIVRRLTPVQLAIECDHPRRGPITVAAYIDLLLTHEEDHLAQIESLMKALAIEAAARAPPSP
jgi:uncharacterized damage-inducible protein DinB